jgi:uncharacterized protein YodC (DUF2158 family)
VGSQNLQEEPMFDVGDIVKLKSGGPRLTITDRSIDRSECKCAWFTVSRSKKKTDRPIRGSLDLLECLVKDDKGAKTARQ